MFITGTLQNTGSLQSYLNEKCICYDFVKYFENYMSILRHTLLLFVV
jgi:hypothetical protein